MSESVNLYARNSRHSQLHVFLQIHNKTIPNKQLRIENLDSSIYRHNKDHSTDSLACIENSVIFIKKTQNFSKYITKSDPTTLILNTYILESNFFSAKYTI